MSTKGREKEEGRGRKEREEGGEVTKMPMRERENEKGIKLTRSCLF